jgi:hypothetical protein
MSAIVRGVKAVGTGVAQVATGNVRRGARRIKAGVGTAAKGGGTLVTNKAKDTARAVGDATPRPYISKNKFTGGRHAGVTFRRQKMGPKAKVRGKPASHSAGDAAVYKKDAEYAAAHHGYGRAQH